MANTSATGGYLQQTGTAPLGQAALENLLHDLVVGICGLPANMVRPRWQPQPPTQPSPSTDWCAFGITRQVSVDYPVLTHTSGGPSTLYRTVELDALASFYGPDCADLAAQLRDGVYIPQNMEALNAAAVVLLEAGELVAVPELTNMQWINQYDLPLRFRWQVARSYEILDILSSQGTITAQDGVTASWDTRNQ